MESNSWTRWRFSEESFGGGSGIRTRDTVSRIHTFQACAFNHSATPPSRRWRVCRIDARRIDARWKRARIPLETSREARSGKAVGIRQSRPPFAGRHYSHEPPERNPQSRPRPRVRRSAKEPEATLIRRQSVASVVSAQMSSPKAENRGARATRSSTKVLSRTRMMLSAWALSRPTSLRSKGE